MHQYPTAFDISPVPVPTADAVAPGHFSGIYGMPSFVTIETTDLDGSVAFWTDVLDFFVLFDVPGRLVHLRRWAFQDVLLVPAGDAASVVADPPAGPTVSFACVLSEIDPLLERWRSAPDRAPVEARDTPWNTRDVTVTTPEHVRVVFTAAKPYDPASEAAANLRAIGIDAPRPTGEDGPRDDPR